MPMSPRLLRPRQGGDPDALRYIAAVQAADGQPLESGVRKAINDFVVGCKADGIWSAIKASCILAGARTLAGALTPLAGTAPTNFNFVSGDYNRKTGLVGNGSTKYLNSGRADNQDPQDSYHQAVWLSSLTTKREPDFYIGVVPSSGGSSSLARSSGGIDHYGRNRFDGVDSITAATGFFGSSRSSSASYITRNNSTEVTTTGASGARATVNVAVFARNNNGTIQLYSNGRIGFYSIGESLTLAAYDSRLTKLFADLSAAIVPQVSNADAQDWVNRVYDNGGTVSAATASAVNQFCLDIENAGIRDRFYRLNLFCGNSDASLAAVRTPLYRGPSLTGTQFGNAMDTNVNFVQGDYSATDGLTSAPSPPKYLTTGLSPDTIGTATGHLSVVVKGAASSAAALGIGSRSSGAAQRHDLQTANRNAFFLDGVLDFYSTATWGATSVVSYQRTGDSTRPAGQYLVTRTSSSRADWYLNGVSVANSTASVTPGANPNEFYVCGINNNGTPFYHGVTTVRGYSLGLSMTGSQAAAFSSAFASLNAALGRA